VQYADFAVWQREWLSGAVLERQLSYWSKQLAGAPPVLELRTDFPRPAVQSHRGATVPFNVTPELTDDLKQLSQRNGVTLFMTLLAAFDVLLMHYTNQTDIVVGTNIANRNRAETENLIGFFINQLVLRVDQSGNPTLVELLERVREITLDAYAHQELPFERLVEELQPERDRSRALLYQAKLEIQSIAPSPVPETPDLKVNFISLPNNVARYDLYLSLADSAQGLQGTMLYNADLFKPGTIARMLENMKTLLHAIVERPAAHLDELTRLLAAKDKQHQELVEKEIENAGLQMLRNIQRRAISRVDV
jgi:non-ribosomal peptide synthetase component F